MTFHEIDLLIFKFIHSDIHNEVFDMILPIIRNKLTWVPLYIYWVYFLYKKYSVNTINIILFAIILIALCDNSCARILKPLIERLRPCQSLGIYEWFRDTGLCSQTFSFPSCHATNHSAIAVFMATFLSSRWTNFLCAWVIGVCIAQVYVGVHYPSDVLGGIVLGTVIGLVVRYLYLVFQNKYKTTRQ